MVVQEHDNGFILLFPVQVVHLSAPDRVHVIRLQRPEAERLFPRRRRMVETREGFDVPRDVWPQELLKPNAEVWLVYRTRWLHHFRCPGFAGDELIDVCPWIGWDPPESYRADAARTKEAWTRDAHARRRRARKRWWQFWI
jgi:hypothetical protein